MCGFIGMYGTGAVATEMADGLLVLQHRGQDAAGIATFDGETFHIERGVGLVKECFDERRLARLPGGWAVGHTRYPTVGSGTADDAQPLYTNSPYGIAMAHNGNVTNYMELRRELGIKDQRRLGTNCDVEVILNVLASALSRAKGTSFAPQVFWAMAEVFKRVKGSYSAAAIVGGHGLVAFRDPYGIKPAILGKRKEGKGTGWCVASESAVLQVLGYEAVGDLAPGEVIVIGVDGRLQRKVIDGRGAEGHRPCVFEYIYFARPDSVIDDISVYKARLRLGESLAHLVRDRDLEPDVVVPVPDSARAAALECARVMGVKYREGLLKNRYVGRTFIMPGQANRVKNVRAKLTPLPLEIEGKKVLLVDDSIVRGTTTREVIRMVRDAGAKAIYLAVSAPPIQHPCVYGVDMQTRDEFIAKRLKTPERIAQSIGADALVYMTIPKMVTAVKGPTRKIHAFCMACMDGNYPTGDVTPATLKSIESERAREARKTEGGRHRFDDRRLASGRGKPGDDLSEGGGAGEGTEDAEVAAATVRRAR
jgi:amidophosphoribosyltransferase